MSSGTKPISGLWVGRGEFIFFLLCIAAAAVPHADNYNQEDKMVITIAMGIAALIVVFIFSRIFNKRAANRGEYAPAQQGMLTVRDRSVAVVAIDARPVDGSPSAVGSKLNHWWFIFHRHFTVCIHDGECGHKQPEGSSAAGT